MRRPLVAITATSRRETPADPERVRLNASYVSAIVRAGGLPVVSPALIGEEADALVNVVDALLLTGGEDIDPALYGAAPHPALARVTLERDTWEIALVRAARARGIPVLGVCRGIQLLNVALGGTLIQDIPSECPGALPHQQDDARSDRTHEITCIPESRLAGIMGQTARVNSMHHQAVASVAGRLAVTATAPDGIIEGVEWPGAEWWCTAVQWHPEELEGADSGLFAAFVGAAAR